MALQGKFKELGKVIVLSLAGAAVGVIEDATVNGFIDGLKSGDFLRGAWDGFKSGIGYLKAAFARLGSKNGTKG